MEGTSRRIRQTQVGYGSSFQEFKKQERVQEAIDALHQQLLKINNHRCFVVELKNDEASVSLDELRGQFTSSSPFIGAAKDIVEYCLSNDLDVYIIEADFSMSCGSIGAEIWVTPKGVAWYLEDKTK